MSFHSLYAQNFVRVAACSIHVSLADPARNGQAVLGVARDMHAQGVALAVFPELCLSGYAIDDLRLQDALLDGVVAAIADLAEARRS